MTIREAIRQLPGMWRIVSPKLKRIEFRSSRDYWQQRYEGSGNSGAGSYGRLAQFKARVLNDFVAAKQIDSLIEFGCGDGNQLSLATYPTYTGLDVSPVALRNCISRFSGDSSKSFFLYDPTCTADNQRIFRADAALSLDVIYHLIEEDVFEAYMQALLSAGERHVVIYASNDSSFRSNAAHVKHRRFTEWIEHNRPEWRLTRMVKNEYPYDSTQPEETSFADFFFFEKQ